jgi:hypothetical protein
MRDELVGVAIGIVTLVIGYALASGLRRSLNGTSRASKSTSSSAG